MPLYIFTVTVLIVVILFTFVTQVIVPLSNGTKMFPWFRSSTPAAKSRVEVEKELAETAEQVEVQKLLNELKRRKAQLEEGNENVD